MKQLPADLLRRLRNDLELPTVVEHLGIPTKRRGNRLAFRCPDCSTFQAAVNPYVNLGRCFNCQRNFNPIDLVMVERAYSFLEAVDFLQRLLPRG